MELQRFVEVLPKIATQPLAILAYLCLVGGWLLWFFRKRKSVDFLQALDAMPRNERATFAQQAGYRYDELAQLSSADRIHMLTRRYRLLAYIATLIGLVLIVLSILITANEAGNTSVSQHLSVGRDMLVNAPGGTISGGVTAGGDIVVSPGAVMQTGPGHVYLTNIQGIPAEQFQLRAEELGVTKAALTSFFKLLEQQRIPLEELDSKLREVATSYKRLQVQLQQLQSEDPAVTALRQEASQALENTDYARVEMLLRQAQERDLHAIQAQQASLKKRQISAAATSAGLGALKNIQLAYAAAATHYRQAAAVVPQEEVITQATYLHEAGVAWLYDGQYADARSALEQALALREQGLGLEHPDVAQSLTYLVLLYRTEGRYADAEPHARRALVISEKVFGPDHPDVAQSLTSLAALSLFQGRYAEAEPLLQRALRIREQALGLEHPDVAESLNPLAMLYHSQGRYAEAEPLLQRALRIREQALGPEHPHVALGLNNLAVLFQAQGRYAEAEPHFLRALAIWEKVHGPEHPHVAMNLNNLAVLFQAQGYYAEAEPRFRRALAIWEKVFGPEHPNLALCLNNLAEISRVQGRYTEAEPLYQRALAIWEKVLDTEHPHVALGLNNLAALYLTQGRYAEAEPRFQRALAIWEKVLSPEHPHVATLVKNYATLLRATHREANAAQLEAQWAAQQPSRAWLGIQMKLSTDPPGVLVEQVMDGSPAVHAGILPHDVVIRFNAQEVLDPPTLLRLVVATAIGASVDIDIIREGQRRTISAILERRPPSRP